jgi:hypothetical protein
MGIPAIDERNGSRFHSEVLPDPQTGRLLLQPLSGAGFLKMFS